MLALALDIDLSAHRSLNHSINMSTYFLSTRRKELVGIHAIGNGATQERKPVIHNRWLISVVEKQLIDDVQNNRDQYQREAIARDAQDLPDNQLR